MPRKNETRDKILSWWLRKWGPEFLQEIIHTPEEARACDTFPSDQIVDFLEMINSNLAVAYLIKFGPEKFVKIIADHINAEKYRITPEELKKRVEAKKAEAEKAKDKSTNKNKKKSNGKK